MAAASQRVLSSNAAPGAVGLPTGLAGDTAASESKHSSPFTTHSTNSTPSSSRRNSGVEASSASSAPRAAVTGIAAAPTGPSPVTAVAASLSRRGLEGTRPAELAGHLAGMPADLHAFLAAEPADLWTASRAAGTTGASGGGKHASGTRSGGSTAAAAAASHDQAASVLHDILATEGLLGSASAVDGEHAGTAARVDTDPTSGAVLGATTDYVGLFSAAAAAEEVVIGLVDEDEVARRQQDLEAAKAKQLQEEGASIGGA